jgi:hypothetical protein
VRNSNNINQTETTNLTIAAAISSEKATTTALSTETLGTTINK